MTQINFDSALLIRQESGPEVIELVGRHANGEQYDFQRDVPRQAGEQWLREFGFESWTERAPGTLLSQRSGRKYAGLVDTLVSGGGAIREILTPQAAGYIAKGA